MEITVTVTQPSGENATWICYPSKRFPGTFNLGEYVTKSADRSLVKVTQIPSVCAGKRITGICWSALQWSDCDDYHGDEYTGFYHGIELRRIPNGIVWIADYAFSNYCEYPELELPQSITEIGEGCFEYSYLESINLPHGLTELGQYAFVSCSKLTHIDIPGTVKQIRNSTFLKCTSLKMVNVRHGVEELEEKCFAECSALEVIYIPSTVKAIAEDAIPHNDNLIVYCELHSFAYYFAKANGYCVIAEGF